MYVYPVIASPIKPLRKSYDMSCSRWNRMVIFSVYMDSENEIIGRMIEQDQGFVMNLTLSV